ncbi:MFS transporter [Chloroflexota bacterium]
MESMESDSGMSAGDKGFRRIDYLKITVFGFALAALWSSLHSIILPVRLLDFVAESQKNTYLGLLTLAGLVIAVAWQPIAGMISDRSGFGWGRRRPYILLGTILVLLFLPGLGFSSSYMAVFAIYCLMQISGNTAQGGYQGFIPDLVPQRKRGLASGVKILLEIGGGIALIGIVGPLMDHYFAGEGSSWLWLSLGLLAIILLGTMIATVLTVKERPGTGGPKLSVPSALYKTFKIDVKANRDFVWFLVSRLFIVMAFAPLQTFTLYFVKDVAGVANPAEVTANLFVVVGVSMLAVIYPAGRLSDRVGRKPIAVFSGLLGASGVLLLYLFHSYGMIMFACILLGISTGAFFSTNWAMATDLVVEGEEARYLGLTNLATAGGAALARLIGPIIDFSNSFSPGLGYSIMLLVSFVYFLIGSGLLLKIRVR